MTAPNGTHGIVIRLIADLILAAHRGGTQCFTVDELRATADTLTVVASRALPEGEYNAKARVLLAGLLDVGLARDPVAMGRCRLASKLKKALAELVALKEAQ
jgi:hypothetical protein